MLSKSKCIINVRNALCETHHLEVSLVTEYLSPIISGHPVHNAVVRLERHYPNRMLPPKGRGRWIRLLRLSRAGDAKVLEAADAFLRWLDKEARRCASEAGSPETQQEDGLIGPGYRLRWGAQELELQPQTWRLLQIVGERDVVAEAELEAKLWGAGGDATPAVKQAVRRANRALEKAGVGWHLRRKDGQIRKERTGTFGDTCVTRLVTLKSP